MAKIQQNSSDTLPNFLFAFASLCLMLSMVIALLLGIKFRWFKHRMVFDQIPKNGDVSGIETNSYRRKKTKPSQQFLEPVIVHGVFRKRQEEDIEYQRPKSLPPIRIRKSSNGPPALFPPRRRSQVQSEIMLENLPKQESPSSISSSSSDSPDLITKNSSPEYGWSNVDKSLHPCESNNELPVDCPLSPTEIIKIEPIYAEPIKRYTPKKSSIHDKMKMSSHSKELNERRPTGFVSLTDDERRELELSAAINEINLINFNLGEENDDNENFNTTEPKSMERKITFYEDEKGKQQKINQSIDSPMAGKSGDFHENTNYG